MSTKEFYTLAELEDLVNDPNFFDELEGEDQNCPLDIVELPPTTVDIQSDEEDINEDVLEGTNVKDVPGILELHSTDMVTPSTSGDNVSSDMPSSKRHRTSNYNKQKINSNWQKTRPDFQNFTSEDTDILASREQLKQTLQGKSPVEVFETLFDEEVMTHIVTQSVTYAAQNNRHGFTMSVDCLRKFLGFLILTGYHSLPQEQMYWCEDEDVCIESVRKCLSRNRYLEIKRNLHFNDNAKLINNKSAERDFKIAPLINKMNDNFLKFGVFSKTLSIDEQMVRYYGHHYMKQFIRGKPIRFGFKQWTMCCAETAYCFHTELYKGKQDDDCKFQGLGTSVVMKNISIISTPSNHVFYFDNFFTSFELMKLLKDQKIAATGTVRYNRMNKCSIKSDNEMKSEHRGAFDYRFDTVNDIFGTLWKDNNAVKMLSNHQGILPLQKVSRWSRSEKKQVKIPQPYCIEQYNKYMGGVDKLDWYINKYRIKIRGKKWYFPIFTNIIDMTVVNAYVLYCMSTNAYHFWSLEGVLPDHI